MIEVLTGSPFSVELLADAATALAGLGLDQAAKIATRQAKLVGSLQYDIVAGHTRSAAETLRRLAPTYEDLATVLGEQLRACAVVTPFRSRGTLAIGGGRSLPPSARSGRTSPTSSGSGLTGPPCHSRSAATRY